MPGAERDWELLVLQMFAMMDFEISKSISGAEHAGGPGSVR